MGMVNFMYLVLFSNLYCTLSWEVDHTFILFHFLNRLSYHTVDLENSKLQRSCFTNCIVILDLTRFVSIDNQLGFECGLMV